MTPHVGLGLATAGSWALLLALPFLPVGWPHGGVRGNIERATIYFVVAAVTRATITDHETRWQIAALAIAAVLLEVGREWIAGSSNGASGWLSSMAGAVVGAALLREIAHAYYWQWGW